MIDLLRNRRSIRKYTNQPVESDKLEILKEAVLRSPSSKNINSWEFIFIDDREVISKLKYFKPHGTTSLETATLAVIVCADSLKNDVWIEDCSIASILLQLTAQSIGLGSCWIQVRLRNHSETVSSETYIRQLLDIHDKFNILSIISAGYPEKIKAGKPFHELQYEKIKLNRF
jgi:nitroreductase